ncbi:MAG: ATP-binding cassette domain-containing protein, partial [Acutalibacteraceae bacterium]
MSAIKLENVTRAFGEKQVLKGISLDISEGEIFGLLGPSGAGKTTIINILTGQLSCGGRAEIFGTDCARIGRKVYREIGAVLDNCGLYERLTCMDNMKLFAGIHNVPLGQIGGILEKVGLTGSEKIKAGKMSKGMKQRLQLARAILHQPKLL